jgi:hypothetical protein
VKLPVFTQNAPRAGRTARSDSNRPGCDLVGRVTPSACTYGPCIGGRMDVQCCDSSGCTTTTQACTGGPLLLMRRLNRERTGRHSFMLKETLK